MTLHSLNHLHTGHCCTLFWILGHPFTKLCCLCHTVFILPLILILWKRWPEAFTIVHRSNGNAFQESWENGPTFSFIYFNTKFECLVDEAVFLWHFSNVIPGLNSLSADTCCFALFQPVTVTEAKSVCLPPTLLIKYGLREPYECVFWSNFYVSIDWY